MTTSTNVRALIRRPLDPDEYQEIRRLWIAHSIAEDARDIPGLIATLTENCLYELPQWGYRWEEHEGAARFYTELLTAFPDVHFDLQNIVIGPQGVWEEAHVTGTHQQDWLDFAATGKAVEFDVSILFPWVPDKGKFSGERVFVFGFDEALRADGGRE